METTGWIPQSLFQRGAWIFGRKPAALYFLRRWEGQGPLEVKYSQNGQEIWSLLLSLIKNRRACCTRGTCNEEFARQGDGRVQLFYRVQPVDYNSQLVMRFASRFLGDYTLQLKQAISILFNIVDYGTIVMVASRWRRNGTSRRREREECRAMLRTAFPRLEFNVRGKG